MSMDGNENVQGARSSAAPDSPPGHPAAAAGDELSRRRLMTAAIAACGGAIAAAIGAPAAGMFIGPLLKKEPAAWRDVGAVNAFGIGDTVQVTFESSAPIPWSGVTAQTAAWLRRGGDSEFTAFAVNCTHLGCPVRWESNADLFFCPCHGGTYYEDGEVAAGPPPRPLDRYAVRVRNGRVEVQAGPLPIR